MILSIIAVISIQLLNNSYEEYLQNGLEEYNGADIKVFSENKNLNTEQKVFIESLSNNDGVEIELFFKKEVNVISKNKIENAIINYKKPSVVDLKPEVSVESNLAKRLDVKRGDIIQVKIFGKLNSCKITEIRKNNKGFSAIGNEMELVEEILGKIDISLSDSDNIYNGAYIKIKNINEIPVIKNKLIEKLGEDFNVRTKNDLFNDAKSRINFHKQMLNIIGIFAYGICGTSICFTFSVINFKRKKYYYI